MNVLSYLNLLRPAIPYSAESTVDAKGKCVLMSNGELRRQAKQGAILFNGERVTADEEVDFPVFSLVFFPNSAKRRCTLI
jgi:hypothetical protein